MACAASLVSYVLLGRGEAHGVRSETKTFSPVTIIHATLGEEGAGSTPSSSRWELPLPSTYNCLVYVRRGSVDVVAERALAALRRLPGPTDQITPLHSR